MSTKLLEMRNLKNNLDRLTKLQEESINSKDGKAPKKEFKFDLKVPLLYRYQTKLQEELNLYKQLVEVLHRKAERLENEKTESLGKHEDHGNAPVH
jgi:hypothetical protein